MLKIEFCVGDTLDDVVKTLSEYKKNNILAYSVFNGETLYSDTVNMDDAYKKVTGKTKNELDNEHKKWMEEYKKKEIERKKNISPLSKTWMEKGRKILDKDKWDLWDRIVPIGLGDLYQGMDLAHCLNIVELLNAGETFEQVKEVMDSQNHSSLSFSSVCIMIDKFCNRGKEFVDFLTNV